MTNECRQSAFPRSFQGLYECNLMTFRGNTAYVWSSVTKTLEKTDLYFLVSALQVLLGIMISGI